MGTARNDFVQIPFSLHEEIESIPMSLADASLVRMSELYHESIVLTIDSDFLIYRKNRNQSISVILPNS